MICDICDNEPHMKRTLTTGEFLADLELHYFYEGSNILMQVLDRFEDMDLITELLEGMYKELPEKKPNKAK